MKIHHLKTVNPYFEEVWSGRKTFDVRKNDRGFKVGDSIWLEEYCPDNGYLTRKILVEVTYILEDYPPLDAGYVILAIKFHDKY